MRAWLALLAILCFSCTVYAQNLTDAVNQFTATGVLPYAPYDGVNDSIAITNGRLHLSVPVLSLPLRAGGRFNVKLIYDSPSWSLSTLPASSDPILTNWIRNEPINVSTGEPVLHWNIPTLSVMPVVVSTYQVDTYTISNYCYTNWIFTDTDGARHIFHNAEICDDLNPPPVHISDALDSAFIRLDTSNNADIVVYMKDGTQVHFYRFDNFAVGKTYHMYPYYSRFGKIVDPNGNVITASDSDPYNVFSSSAFIVTDSVGRAIAFNGPFNGPVTYKDSNGVTQTISTASTTLATGNPIITSHPVDGDCHISGQYGVEVGSSRRPSERGRTPNSH